MPNYLHWTFSTQPGGTQTITEDYELPESQTLSLTLADAQGREITIRQAASVPAALEFRTERPVVLGEEELLRVEAWANVDAGQVAAHGLTAELVVIQEGEEGEVLATRRIDSLPGRQVRIAFDASESPLGTYVVRGALTRGDQTVAEARSQHLLRAPRPAGGIRRVTFDRDGMMLVDGKRVFPIGMLANFEIEDVAEFKKVGMNCVMFGGPTMGRSVERIWALLNALHEAGIYAIGGVHPSVVVRHRRQQHRETAGGLD